MAADTDIQPAQWVIPPDLIPDYDNLVIEDGKPVDSIFAEKQMRLLTEPLHSSWRGPGGGEGFIVTANVGLFFALKKPALVPDVMLATGVEQGDLSEKENRSYFVWEHGKAPDVVVEIVSDTKGGEEDRKFTQYARIGVRFYVIFDPFGCLGHGRVRTFRLEGEAFAEVPQARFEPLGLALVEWHGQFEDATAGWLRWTDLDGRLIPNGAEHARRADAETRRADAETRRADAERERAERLAAKLKALGVDPDA